MSSLDLILKIVAPVSLALIMCGMGLTIRVESFRNFSKRPKALLLGLFAQIFLLPILAVTIAITQNLPTEIAFGLILLSVCPGGATSNVISFIIRADVALSISLTTISSLLIIVAMPLVLYIATEYVLDMPIGTVEIPKKTLMVQLFVLTVAPVSAGMVIGNIFPNAANRMEKPTRIFSVVTLIMLVSALLIKDGDYMIGNMKQAGGLVIELLLVAMTMSYVLAKLFGLPIAQKLSIIVEVGMQNGLLAIIIATNVIGDPKLALFPSAYGMISLLGVSTISFIYTYWSGRGRRDENVS